MNRQINEWRPRAWGEWWLYSKSSVCKWIKTRKQFGLESLCFKSINIFWRPTSGLAQDLRRWNICSRVSIFSEKVFSNGLYLGVHASILEAIDITVGAVEGLGLKIFKCCFNLSNIRRQMGTRRSMRKLLQLFRWMVVSVQNKEKADEDLTIWLLLPLDMIGILHNWKNTKLSSSLQREGREKGEAFSVL